MPALFEDRDKQKTQAETLGRLEAVSALNGTK
jgi:hypothetical protein